MKAFVHIVILPAEKAVVLSGAGKMLNGNQKSNG